MASINLLPWREEQRQQRQKNFFISLATALIFAVAVFVAALFFLDDLIDEQKNRNTFLQQEITALDQEIKEVDALLLERKNLLARMRAIQDLQISRPKVIKVLDALVRSVPKGIYLEDLARKDDSLIINGVATSNDQVSEFMRRLEKNDQFLEPKLKIVQRASNKDAEEGDTSMTFSLNVNESKPEVEDESEDGGN